MGNAKIWYYPDGLGGSLEEIDLGEELTTLIEQPFSNVQDAYNGSGRMYRAQTRAGMMVRFLNENFGGPSDQVERDLVSLQRHLEKGRAVSIAADADKAFCGFAVDTSLSRGTSALPVTTNAFFNYASVTVLSTDDEVTVGTGLPELQREYLKVSSHTSDTLTTSRGLRYAHEQGPIYIRHRDFFPVLRMPQGSVQPMVTHRNRIVHTWDIVLEEDIQGLLSLFNETGQLELNDPDVEFIGGTLDEQIDEGNDIDPSAAREVSRFTF